MKRIRAVAVLVAITTLVGGVGIASSASASGGQVHSRWTDRQVVEGVALGVGPVAIQLGIAQEPTPGVSGHDLAVGRRVENDILSNMMNEHRNGVHDAVALLESGDPYRVESGRARLAAIFRESLDSTHPDLAVKAGLQPRCGLIAACAVVAVLGAALGVAVVIVAEAAVVGHAAVYAKQALWGKSEVSDAGSDSGATIPSFSSAEFNARIATKLAQ